MSVDRRRFRYDILRKRVAVTDFKLADFDIELDLGYGLTSGSDPLIAKAIIDYDFPVPGSTNKSNGTSLKRLW